MSADDDTPRRAVSSLRVPSSSQTLAVSSMRVPSSSEQPAARVAFFDLQSGLKLALWPRASIAHDTGIRAGSLSPTEFTLGHNVASSSEVDAVMEQAKRAGGTIVKPAHETFWGGYAGYFQDPDGHLWEIAWNPQWNAPE